MAKLPMKQQLSLCEMVTFLAWGEAMTADKLEISLSPTERAYQAEWDAQLEECRRQAGAKSELSYLFQLLDDWRDTPTMPTADALDKVCKSEALVRMVKRGELDNAHKEPTPEQHKTIRETWPMACRLLYDLALARRNRRLSEKENLRKAARRWQEAAQDGNLIVTGKRRGVRYAKREVIDHADFAVYELD